MNLIASDSWSFIAVNGLILTVFDLFYLSKILTQSNYLTFTSYILHFKANILMWSTYRGVSPISLVSKLVFISTFNLQRSTQSCPLIGEFKISWLLCWSSDHTTLLCQLDGRADLTTSLAVCFILFSCHSLAHPFSIIYVFTHVCVYLISKIRCMKMKMSVSVFVFIIVVTTCWYWNIISPFHK